MTVTQKTILKHLSKLYAIANNTTSEETLLDKIEDELYEMLEYINEVRRRKQKCQQKVKL